jgi:DNA-binding transcriptional ArsR family regulator
MMPIFIQLLPFSCFCCFSLFYSLSSSVFRGYSLLLFQLKRLAHDKDSSSSSSSSDDSNGYMDPRFKRVLWYLIGSTKGGVNRAKILEFVNTQPANANQIATQLKLDYKTVIHHLKVLSENGLIITDTKDSYGATYFLTPLMEKNYPSFESILAKIGNKNSGSSSSSK